jgi:uroporphyrin-III C-methyltransferase
MTVRGVECLRKAEIVYYDHLVSKEILTETPPYAELFFVGKESGQHSVPQERINSMICAAVRRGNVVVRLKGGDPFVFGRGGEEAAALARANLPFEVVPGVTAGVAVAAYAGIPITHRGVSSAVTFVTGHETPDKAHSQIDWEALARLPHTLCIYMGVRNLPLICECLIRGGRTPSEPAAVIESGTLPQQRCVTGTLADIAERAKRASVKPPALVIIGEVARFRHALQWFEGGPQVWDGPLSRLDAGPEPAIVGVRS